MAEKVDVTRFTSGCQGITAFLASFRSVEESTPLLGSGKKPKQSIWRSCKIHDTYADIEGLLQQASYAQTLKGNRYNPIWSTKGLYRDLCFLRTS